jgi:hypothetical protein
MGETTRLARWIATSGRDDWESPRRLLRRRKIVVSGLT